MRKLTLLLGALGGAMAGYVFSNKKLREELSDAKDAEAAGRILAKHLSHDGKQVGHEVKKFIDSDEVQENLQKAKEYAMNQAKQLQDSAVALMKEGQSQVMSYGKKAAKSAQKTVKSTAKKVKAKR